MPRLEEAALTVQGLDVALGGRRVLVEVSFGVAAGEVVAIVGPSGAGKTTLLQCLCGLTRPECGRIVVDGVELSTASRRERDRARRLMFGFVFQFGDLVPELSIRENVALPLRLQGWSSSEALREAHDRLESLGISSLADESISHVSGGETQRAAIARALVHRPAVVLADEPTGALDEYNSRLVFGELLRHARAQGAGVVIVTHERWLAAGADRVLRLDAGRLRAA